VCILWRSTFGLLIGLISSKVEQAAIFTDRFCPSGGAGRLPEPGLQPCEHFTRVQVRERGGYAWLR